MSGDRRLEDQIQQFYDSVPDVDDALPMKDYLLKNENNQMAWYLLGKQYAARGEEGKANYCFAQAGPVFEAFESRTNPLSAAAAELTGPGKSIKRKRRPASAAAGLLVLLFGLLFAGDRANAPDKEDVAVSGGGVSEAAAEQPVTAPGRSGGTARVQGLAYVSGASDAGESGTEALGKLLTATPADSDSLLVQTPVLDKKWIDWLKSGKPIAAVEASSSSDSAANITWYDPRWCPCRSGQDASKARETVAAWRPLQEGKLVLRSAMAAYQERTGKWPASEDELAAAYPANELAGWSSEMTDWLDELKRELNRQTADGKQPSLGWPDASGPKAGDGRPAGELDALAEKPLEIIVDKTNHRLAVVSGNVLLRNYEVGLGGDRTPEGQFVITEKVRDPNGRPDGEFGSRGMTLSDTLYAIHGTDEPDSIGMDESHGCIRMKKEDLEELYDLVAIGTRVRIVEEGLPDELRAPKERFRLKPAQNETNPGKQYRWLN